MSAERAYLSNLGVFFDLRGFFGANAKKVCSRIGKTMEFFGEAFLRMMRAFEKYDTNGNGRLSIAELKAVLKRRGGGSPLTDEDVAEIIAQFDKNEDGELQLSEFALMWGPYFEGVQFLHHSHKLVLNIFRCFLVPFFPYHFKGLISKIK